MKVARLEPFSGTPERGLVHFEDGSQAWSPNLDKMKVGDDLAKWTWKDGPKGKQVFEPREKGAGAFRNTKEGFDSEQASIHRSLAVKLALRHAGEMTHEQVFQFADEIYTWLRTTGGALGKVATERQAGPARVGLEPSPPSSGKSTDGHPSLSHGDAVAGGCPSCGATESSPLKPDGKALPKNYVRCLSCSMVRKG